MRLNIVLVEPEIPQNTGNIARTCAALGAKLHLVHQLGFSISEKAVKRAGLDYWDKLEIEEHLSFEKFLEKYKPEENNMFFVTTKGKHVYSEPKYGEIDVYKRQAYSSSTCNSATSNCRRRKFPRLAI